MTSIKTRMVWSYILLIVLVLFVIGAIFITLILNYYYTSAQSSLEQFARANIAQNGYILGKMTTRDKAEHMYEIMQDGQYRVQLLDYKGTLQIDSNGLGGAVLSTPDVKAAMNGEMNAWEGKDPFYQGERVAAITVPLLDRQRVTGLLRYSASLEQIDSMVWRIIRWTLFTGGVVVLLFLGVSMWIAQRIVKPIQELTHAASIMAKGDWTQRAEPRQKDEIGQLATTFNMLAKELTKREKMKNDFISSVSHELRTPLTSIKGWSETLNEEEIDREEMDLGLKIIHRETDRLSGLVEDLLDFSKLSARSIELFMELIDLNGPVKESIGQLSIRQEQTGVNLVLILHVKPILVKGDANRLKQVLINLIDNAYKFTPPNGTITVETLSKGESAVLTVSDTGCGIDPEDLPHVTEKFYKGSAGKAGSGLGLAICKEIIELHGGRMTVDSKQGTGTIITITLPLH